MVDLKILRPKSKRALEGGRLAREEGRRVRLERESGARRRGRRSSFSLQIHPRIKMFRSLRIHCRRVTKCKHTEMSS